MDKREYLLTCFIEECSELQIELGHMAQRATKALRFGMEETQPGQDLTNQERFLDELADFVGTIGALFDAKALRMPKDFDFDGKIAAKRERIKEFMRYSRKLGVLKDD